MTANAASVTAGTAIPALTANITGLVNGDTAAVVTGSPGLSTTATAGVAGRSLSNHRDGGNSLGSELYLQFRERYYVTVNSIWVAVAVTVAEVAAGLCRQTWRSVSAPIRYRSAALRL